MRRGDVVVIALSGDYGKPRPALVIQSAFFEAHPSVTILPVTSELRDTPLFRIDVAPALTTACASHPRLWWTRRRQFHMVRSAGSSVD